MIADATIDVNSLQGENQRLRQELRLLELKIETLKQQLWGKKSERFAPGEDQQARLFEDPKVATGTTEPAATTSGGDLGTRPRAAGKPKGPKPLDPSLPRELITLPVPELKALICPVNQQPMRPGFSEVLEVLARRPAVYFVKRYERTVFVSAAKTAPVYTPWPADVLARSRVHVSIVAHIAAAHFCEHVPYHRLEQQLARSGVELPRVCQVSLMRQLDERLAPLVVAIKVDVLRGDYLMLDATSVAVCDPQRPGATREATLWAYRNAAGTVWFEYQTSKSPQHPDRLLKAVNFSGLLQTDAASGLGAIGPAGQVISLACFAHARRYFFDAWRERDRLAEFYLSGFNRLFRIDRLAKHFGLSLANKATLRTRHSIPLFDRLLARAQHESPGVLPKSQLGKALHYLLAQQAPLRRTLSEARAELSTNGVERAIRPLKLGAKNWLHVGHPDAGPRLANLFTVVENCRLLGLEPEAYLIDIITRLPDHPAARVAELLPQAWQQSRQSRSPAGPVAATSPAAAPD